MDYKIIIKTEKEIDIKKFIQTNNCQVSSFMGVPYEYAENSNTTECKICEREATSSYNVDFKKVYVCERCARRIALQEITDVLSKASQI